MKIELADGRVYERSGECNRCGECCVNDPFNGEEGKAVVEGFCPLYRIIGNKGHCSNRHHPYYLAGCNVYPTAPEQIADKPSCSYTFTRLTN